MKKRSLSIHGHPTSVALEPEFWAEIDRAAIREGRSVSSLIAGLDDVRLSARPEQGLASYIRVWVLERVRKSRDEFKGFHVGDPVHLGGAVAPLEGAQDRDGAVRHDSVDGDAVADAGKPALK